MYTKTGPGLPPRWAAEPVMSLASLIQLVKIAVVNLRFRFEENRLPRNRTNPNSFSLLDRDALVHTNSDVLAAHMDPCAYTIHWCAVGLLFDTELLNDDNLELNRRPLRRFYG